MKIQILLFSSLILATLIIPTHAETFSTTDIAKHNTKEDCWMSFEGKVYDFSAAHLQNHEDKFMNIEAWCGKDMTTDFKTKDGEGKDHRSSTYKSLDQYLIGTVLSAGTGTDTNNSTSTSNSEKESENPYNFWLPAILGAGSYLGYWMLTKTQALKKHKLFNKNTFNFTFNTIMLLGLIPSIGFGIFMIAAYSFDSLSKIDFDFLYWHVELSVALSSLFIGHFLTRFKLYKAPLRLFTRKTT